MPVLEGPNAAEAAATVSDHPTTLPAAHKVLAAIPAVALHAAAGGPALDPQQPLDVGANATVQLVRLHPMGQGVGLPTVVRRQYSFNQQGMHHSGRSYTYRPLYKQHIFYLSLCSIKRRHSSPPCYTQPSPCSVQLLGWLSTLAVFTERLLAAVVSLQELVLCGVGGLLLWMSAVFWSQVLSILAGIALCRATCLRAEAASIMRLSRLLARKRCTQRCLMQLRQRQQQLSHLTASHSLSKADQQLCDVLLSCVKDLLSCTAQAPRHRRLSRAIKLQAARLLQLARGCSIRRAQHTVTCVTNRLRRLQARCSNDAHLSQLCARVLDVCSQAAKELSNLRPSEHASPAAGAATTRQEPQSSKWVKVALALHTAVALATGIAAAADMLLMVALPSFTLPAMVAGVVVVPWLLAACGDIEENPGPPTTIAGIDVQLFQDPTHASWDSKLLQLKQCGALTIDEFDAAFKFLREMGDQLANTWLAARTPVEAANKLKAEEAAAARARAAEAAAAAAAANRAAMSDDDIVENLLKRYQQYFGAQRLLHKAAAMRQGPIELDDNGMLKSTGLHFKLAAYRPAVDHLIRALLRLAKDFQPQDVNRFLRLLQVLRVISAPGMGKTTFVNLVWGMVAQRLEAVERAGGALWRDWQQYGASKLKERLASWKKEAGELVFQLDMSNSNLHELHAREEGLNSSTQLAARMLWSTLLSAMSYGDMLQQLSEGPYPLLTRLTPLIVLRFIHQAARLEDGKPSIVVFVWDEVNAVKAAKGQQPTFVQEHLSAAVVTCRCSALEDTHWHMDMMPVIVAASTRGNASNLATTASKQALVRDLRLPLPSTNYDKKLVVMDLLSRLPSSNQLATHLGINQPNTLLDLSEQELVNKCPVHLAEALAWCGANMRIVEHLLGVMTGQQHSACLNMKPCTLVWVTNERSSQELPDLLNTLIELLMSHGWEKWLTNHDSTTFMFAAVAHAQCKVLVSRSTVLMRGPRREDDVTVAKLEADGVVELCLPSGEPAPSRRSSHSRRSTHSGGSSGSQDVEQQHDVEVEGINDFDLPNPDTFTQYRLIVTPLLLVAYLRQLRRFEDRCSGLQVVKSLLESWRSREFDDMSCLTLTLQLHRDYFKHDWVLLSELCPLLANTIWGDLQVQVPESGFAASEIRSEMDEVNMRQLVEACACPPASGTPPPWCFVFNGSSGPGDSMMVLQEGNGLGQRTGNLITVCVQSKLRRGKEAVTWNVIAKEAAKVHILGQGVKQIFMYVTDQHPSKRKRNDELGDELDKLINGHPVSYNRNLPVVAVFRDQAWPLRGAAGAVKKLLQEHHERTGMTLQ